MSSHDQSSIDQSGIDESPPLPPSSIPGQEKPIERIINNRGIRTFLVMDHTANLRKNSKISAIWYHGGERRRLDDDSMTRYWRCAHCTGSAQIEARLITALLGDAALVEDDVE